MKTKLKIIMMLLVGLLVLPVSALAFEAKTGETIEVDSDEVIEDDIIAAGATVRIKGIVKGDIKVAGSILEIDGNVEGDVIAVGSQVVIRGEIADDLYVVGGQVTIDNRVGDNAMFIGGTVALTDDASIGRDLWAMGGLITLDGNIGRNLTVNAGEVQLSSEVGGDVGGEVEKFKLGKNAVVKGDFKYKATSEAEIADGAQVLGITEFTEVERQKNYNFGKEIMVLSPLSLIFGGFMLLFFRMASLFLVGLVMALLFRRELRSIVDKLTSMTGASFGWGLVVIFLTPILVIALLITLVGIPLAVILGAVYGVLMYLAKIVISVCVGDAVIKLFKGKQKGRKKKEVHLVWSLLLGVVLVSIVFAIPFLGGLVKFVALIFGLGAIYLWIKAYIENRK